MFVMLSRMAISLDLLDYAICKNEAEHHGCVELQTINTLPLKAQVYPQDRVDVAQLGLLELCDDKGIIELINSWHQVDWQDIKEEDVSPSKHHLAHVKKPGSLHCLLLRHILDRLCPLSLLLLYLFKHDL